MIISKVKLKKVDAVERPKNLIPLLVLSLKKSKVYTDTLIQKIKGTSKYKL